jgi:hypothetical protein
LNLLPPEHTTFVTGQSGDTETQEFKSPGHAAQPGDSPSEHNTSTLTKQDLASRFKHVDVGDRILSGNIEAFSQKRVTSGELAAASETRASCCVDCVVCVFAVLLCGGNCVFIVLWC